MFRELAHTRTLPLLIALTACGGESPPSEGGARPAPWVADTQVVRDSLGRELEVITRRPARLATEVELRAGSGDPDAPGRVASIPPRRAHELMRAATPGWYVIDVRDSEQYVREGWIPGAALFERSRLEENLGDLHVRTDQTVLVYDEDGSRGREAARFLASYGLPVVRWIEGGYVAWKEAGLPVDDYSAGPR